MPSSIPGSSSGPPSGPKGRIKGAALAQFLAWYQLGNGEAAILDSLAVCDLKFQGTFTPTQNTFGVLASRWYPAEAVHCVLDELTRRHTAEELAEMAVVASDAIMSTTLRGIYRAVLEMFGTAERYSKHADKLWGLHYDTGRPVFRILSPNEHRVSFEGWRSHHPFICKLNMASARPLYAAMGYSGVRFQPLSCISNGGARCENTITWE